MNQPFKEFFVAVMSDLILQLATYGCAVIESGKIECHSLKFAKALLTFSMMKKTEWLAKFATGAKYTFASDKMIKQLFSETQDEYYVRVGAKKKLKKINPLLEKHFSVIFRELSKCYPSTIVFIGTNVGKDDYEVYAKQQFLEGKPIDVRRLKKIKEKEGIFDKKSGFENEQE